MKCTDRQGGFTYLMLLIVLSILALSWLKSSDEIQMRHREQQEAELLFRGDQIRAAIAAYRATGSGCFPVRFEQLLTDRRGKKPRYHLRQHYSDPLTNSKNWGMIYDPQGRWIGVRSQGKGGPRKKAGFRHDAERFSQAKSYYDWRFEVESDAQAPLPRACGG
jgi:type II secretory pathway pseudopilin PulG